MCFSAAGSFAVAGVLAGVGAAALAQNSSRKHRMFAATPLLFGAQQAAEGVVWMTVPGMAHSAVHATAVMAFLGFALVVWPAYLPISLGLMEKDLKRRRILAVVSVFGVLVSAGAWVLLARWQPIASIVGHSIHYEYGRGEGAMRDIALLMAYAVPTVIPWFVSTAKFVRTIGVTLVVSLVVTFIAERETFTSVWCFFAAILSGQIFVAVRREERSRVPVLATRLRP